MVLAADWWWRLLGSRGLRLMATSKRVCILNQHERRELVPLFQPPGVPTPSRHPQRLVEAYEELLHEEQVLKLIIKAQIELPSDQLI